MVTMDVDSPPRRSNRKRSIPHTSPTNSASRPPKKPKTEQSHQETQETQQDDTPNSYMRIYCMGNNDNGELGLGAQHGIDDVRVPTLNAYLSYPSSPSLRNSSRRTTATIKAKVIQLAVGGMHCAVLTSTNEILTWGVNDNGALGRDTSSARLEELIKNLTLQDDGDGQEDREDLDLNILEARPGPVIFFDANNNNTPTPKDKIPKWKQLVACDSATFVLSTTGLVYGWGCTRSSQGISLWSSTPHIEIQRVPVPIPLNEKITKLSARGNHILALTEAGQVYTWGAGSEQGQLGRRLPKRSTQHLECAVTPRKIKLNDVVDIATGPDHSFAIDSTGKIWGWGLDNYAQTGVTNANRSEEGAGGLFIDAPTRLTNLEKILNGRKVRYLTGGNSHSLCLLDDGSVWSWGRVDNCATGLDLDELRKDEGWEKEWIVKDGRERARIVLCPVRILPRGEGDDVDGGAVKWVEAGAEHGVAVTEGGRVVTWGFNASHQTGHNGEEVKVPKVIAMKGDLEGVEFSWAGAGGHFTILGEEVGL